MPKRSPQINQHPSKMGPWVPKGRLFELLGSFLRVPKNRWFFDRSRGGNKNEKNRAEGRPRGASRAARIQRGSDAGAPGSQGRPRAWGQFVPRLRSNAGRDLTRRWAVGPANFRFWRDSRFWLYWNAPRAFRQAHLRVRGPVQVRKSKRKKNEKWSDKTFQNDQTYIPKPKNIGAKSFETKHRLIDMSSKT